MSLRKLFVTASLAAAAWAAAPARASADWMFTPFIGGTFGGSATLTGLDTENEFERRLNYGAALTYVGDGAVGFEIDFGYSPNFFRSDGDNGVDFIGDGNLTTAMANIVFSAPHGGVRPYASGGIGLIKSSVDDIGQFFGSVDNNDLGFNAGAGVGGFFNDNVGIRGDIRFFRSFHDSADDGVDLDLGSLKFWRGTVGISFKF
jgi:opacity protein-like surface antigen